jgi:hypothetical protein
MIMFLAIFDLRFLLIPFSKDSQSPNVFAKKSNRRIFSCSSKCVRVPRWIRFIWPLGKARCAADPSIHI